jgi:hypothetical protein
MSMLWAIDWVDCGGFGHLCICLVTAVIGWIILSLFRQRNHDAPIVSIHNTERAIKYLSMSEFGWGNNFLTNLRFHEGMALSLVCKSFRAAVRRRASPLPLLGGPLATPARLARVVSAKESGLGRTSYSRGVALTPCQNGVVVTDPSNQRIVVLDAASGRPLSHLAPPAGVMPCPVGIALVPHTDQVLIVDRQRCQVLLFAGLGSSELVRTYSDGGPGDGDRQLAGPCGVALVMAADVDSVTYQIDAGVVAAAADPTLVAIADTGNHRVSLYRLFDSSFVRHLGHGKWGNAPGVFTFPHTIAVVPSTCTPDGHSGWLVVADENHRVQVLTQRGEVVRVLVGNTVNGLGALSQALWGITVYLDADGQAELLVSDTNHHRVVAFALDGRAARVVCGDTGSGHSRLSSPSGLTVGAGGDLWLADEDMHTHAYADSCRSDSRICLIR